MARKPLTPEQIAKRNENLTKAREAAKKNREAKIAEKPGDEVPLEPEQPVTNPMPTPSNEIELIKIVENLSRQVAELQAQKGQPESPSAKLDQIVGMRGAAIGPQGVQGQVFRYPVDKGYYPDPTPRLYDDPSLRRFSMRENYYFKWDVTGEQYEKYGISYAEPRFWVELYRYLFDDDGITPNGKMVLVARQLQHEDEFTARVMATKMKMPLEEFEGDTAEEKFASLMNEMRYQRIRQWLLGIFSKPRIEQHRRRPTTQIIDGKVVEVYDTESVIDGEAGVSKASSLQSQVGIGNIAVPE